MCVWLCVYWHAGTDSLFQAKSCISKSTYGSLHVPPLGMCVTISMLYSTNRMTHAAWHNIILPWKLCITAVISQPSQYNVSQASRTKQTTASNRRHTPTLKIRCKSAAALDFLTCLTSSQLKGNRCYREYIYGRHWNRIHSILIEVMKLLV